MSHMEIDYILCISSLNTYGEWISWVKSESNKLTCSGRRILPQEPSINTKLEKTRASGIKSAREEVSKYKLGFFKDKNIFTSNFN